MVDTDFGGYTHEVEVDLAALWGRPRRIRVARGTCASREVVEQFVRQSCLNKAGYSQRHKAGKLPAGFPSDPRQQWRDWSWWKARGNGVPRSELVLEYPLAKTIIGSWQRVHGPLTGPVEYERARRSNVELHVLPLQPDNRKAGGLRGWVSWTDFLALDRPVWVASGDRELRANPTV